MSYYYVNSLLEGNMIKFKVIFILVMVMLIISCFVFDVDYYWGIEFEFNFK